MSCVRSPGVERNRPSSVAWPSTPRSPVTCQGPCSAGWSPEPARMTSPQKQLTWGDDNQLDTCWTRVNRTIMNSMWLEFSAQPISIPKTHSRKSPQTFARLVNLSKMYLPRLIIIKSCYFECRIISKPFRCSRCVICMSCSVHVISTFYVRKGL